MKRFLKFILLCLWGSLIFYMSHQSGGASGGMSDKIFSYFANVLPILKNYEEICLFFIRKGAHVFEYLVLGGLVYEFFKDYILNLKKLVIVSLLFCLIFACFDEIHQLFIIGRSGKILDVLIDSIGYCISIIILTINYILNFKRKLESNN